MSSELEKREQHILWLAHRFVTQLGWSSDALDEATIDAEFLFRFEAVWCAWVGGIRQMMRAMMGEEGCEPLSLGDGMRWLMHLEQNAGLRVSAAADGGCAKHRVTTSRGTYECFDPVLAAAVRRALGNATVSPELWERLWMEAGQTAKVEFELYRLARAYNLVPLALDADRNAASAVKQQFRDIEECVILGRAVPSFPQWWPAAKLLESRTGVGYRRTVRPCPSDGPSTGQRRMDLDTRVRTWAVYYLTRRGGGERSEESALELWNGKFPDRSVEPRRYRADRAQAFSAGTEIGRR